MQSTIRRTCAGGGPVFHPLESVRGDESGAGSATTEVSPATMAEKMRELRGERGQERMREHRDEKEGEGAGARERMEGHEGMAHGPGHPPAGHPPLFIQAHAPDGTPVACGEIPTEEKEEDGY